MLLSIAPFPEVASLLIASNYQFWIITQAILKWMMGVLENSFLIFGNRPVSSCFSLSYAFTLVSGNVIQPTKGTVCHMPVSFGNMKTK